MCLQAALLPFVSETVVSKVLRVSPSVFECCRPVQKHCSRRVRLTVSAVEAEAERDLCLSAVWQAQFSACHQRLSSHYCRCVLATLCTEPRFCYYLFIASYTCKTKCAPTFVNAKTVKGAVVLSSNMGGRRRRSSLNVHFHAAMPL